MSACANTNMASLCMTNHNTDVHVGICCGRDSQSRDGQRSVGLLFQQGWALQ